MRQLKLFFVYTIFFSFIFIITTYLLSNSSSSIANGELVSPVLFNSNPNSHSFSPEYTTGLKNAVEKALEGSQGNYSVVVKDLTNENTYSYNPQKVFQTASLYKLWTMAVIFQNIDQGKLKREQVLSGNISELNEAFKIASEEAELNNGEINLTLDEAVQRMITASENYPALLLTKLVGISKIANFLKEESFIHSNVGQPPKTSASDIASFYEKLYHHEFASKESSEEMLKILKKQQLNDRIPKYLPASLSIAHKTGELAGFKHDAGIIFTPDRDYVLVILSESNNPLQASERIALIAKNIYSYLAAKD